MSQKQTAQELVQHLLGSEGEETPQVEEEVDWGDCFFNPNRGCNRSCMAFSPPVAPPRSIHPASGAHWTLEEETPCLILRHLGVLSASAREMAMNGQTMTTETTRVADLLADIRNQVVQIAQK